MTLFVDTSAFYAAADVGDRGNPRATEVLRTDEDLVTTDHVLVESWLLVRHRLGRPAADRLWHGLRSGVAAVEWVTPADLDVAWEIAQGFADQDFSIVDRTSFAVMERLGLTRAVSFDDDFAIYRYGRNRERAFEVVR